MIAKSITSASFSDGKTAPPRRGGLTSVFFKIIKPLFLLLVLPGLLLSAARATPVPGATITLNGGQLTNVFSSDDFTVTFTTAQTGLTASNFTVTGTVTGAFVSNVTGSGTSWTVTVAVPGSFQSLGTFTLNLANSTNLSPGLSGLPVSGPTVQVIKYPLDGTFSLSSSNANSGYAKTGDKINFTLQSAHYELEFWGVNVAGQSASGGPNFSPQATGLVTLGSGTAQGALAWSWNYTNTFNESDNGSGTSGIIFDSVNPTVNISAPSVSSTGTDPVTYNVTYADANFNTSTLSTSNITLNTTGSATGTVTLVENSATNYTVTISNITGAGTLGISIAAGTASDLAGNLAPASSLSTTFNVAPALPTTTSLSSNNNPSFSVAPGNSVTFTATVSSFGSPVSTGTVSFTSNGIAINFGSNVALNGSGQAAVTTSFATADAYTIQATYSGNSNFSSSNGSLNQQVNLHPTTISSITAGSTYSNASSIQFTVTFGASVSGLSASNFSLATTGSINGATVASVSPSSGSTYTVTVNTGTGDGTIGLNLSDASGLTPGISTSLPFTGGTTVIDKTPPLVTIGAPSATITNTGPVTFDVSFSDANFNSTSFSNSNITVTPAGTASYTQVTTVQNSATDFTVSVDGITGDGTLSISVQAGTSQDLAGNTDAGAGPSATFTVDNTAPTALTLVYSSGNANPSAAKVGDMITIDFTTSETVNTPALTIAGHSITPTNVSGNEWVGTYTMTSGDAEGRIPFSLSFTDLAGNPQPGSPYTDAAAGDDIEFDMTPPTAAISAPSVTQVSTAGSGTVTYTVTYADANFNTSNLDNSGITLNSPGTATATVAVTGSGTTYTVTLSNITGLGTLGISLGAGYAADLAGNTDAGAGPSATFNVVSSDATLAGLSISSGTLSPSFSSGHTTYTANVPYSVSSITVSATPDNPNASGVLTLVNGSPASGPAPLNVGANTVKVTVIAQDGTTTDSYAVTITRAASVNANLARITLAGAVAIPGFAPATTAYAVNVPGSTATETITPTVSDPNASVTVNGSPVTSGTASGPITLALGDNTVTLVVTAPNGTTKTYTVTITRVLSSNANLSNLAIRDNDKLNADVVALSTAFNFRTMTYVAAVPASQSSVTVKPTSMDANSVITVNGATVATKTFSNPIALNTGVNTITIVVTAAGGNTQTYTVTVTRAASPNAYLSNLVVNTAALSPAFAYNTFTYTADVPNATGSVTIKANVIQAGAAFTVNGAPGQAKLASDPIALAVGDNTITVIVIAPDNSTTQTYTVTVTRDPGAANTVYQPVGVEKPTEGLAIAEDGIKVHQGISPNGDGIEDFLQIDNISQYPDNKLSIMNRNGQLIFETKRYDNNSKIFDGHSNKNGQMQLPGTYFYQLDYTVSGVTKHKTGFIVLKY